MYLISRRNPASARALGSKMSKESKFVFAIRTVYLPLLHRLVERNIHPVLHVDKVR